MTRPDQTRPDQTVAHARNSSLELLRIVSMLLIIAIHFSVHGGFDFPLQTISINKLGMQFAMAGRCGTDIFVLLTGYFLVKSKGIKYNRLFSLWLRLFFYSVVLYLLFVISGLQAFDLKTLLFVMRPVTKVQWWFVSTYFVLYLLHPHINLLLHAMSRKEYQKFLTAVFFYWSIIPTLTNSSFGASAITNFICLYSLAGYIRLWADDFGSKKYILLGIFFFAVNCLSVVVLDLLGLKFTYFAEKSLYFCERMKPFTVLSALCMLIGFKNLNIKHNSMINTMASATIGVYLIHDHNLVRPFLWHEVFRNSSFQNSPYLIPYPKNARKPLALAMGMNGAT